MDTGDFLDLFLTESREHIEGMTALLASARRGPLASEDLNELFRHAHSLKGMASTMGFHSLARLAHAMEDVFHRWRDREIEPSDPLIEGLQRAADHLASQIDRLAAGGQPDEDAALADSLRGLLPPAPDSRSAADAPSAKSGREPSGGGANPAGGLPRPAEPAGDSRPCLSIEVRLRAGAHLPAARGLVVLKRLESLGRVLECRPQAAEIVPGRFEGVLRLTLASTEPARTIEKAIRSLPDVEMCRATPDPARRGEGGRSDPADRTDRPGSDPDVQPPGPRTEAVHTIRVATERMDRLLDGVGELILDRERLKLSMGAEPGPSRVSILEGLGRTIDTLRDEVMAMRLIPFSSIAPRLERTVRELCHRLGKKVDLVVEGGDVSIDRSILEELTDPLQHILRNSIDHGVEPPEERAAAGKPASGRIVIGLTRHEERVALRVEDDGRGIDPAALRRVAVERRFVGREAAESLSDEEAVQLITLPGFSTAHRTTEISGRGVGMDVVQTQVRKLGGRLHIRSRAGLGTRFEMDLPLTVTVTRAFLCRAAGEIYAVPVSIVLRTLALRPERIQGSRGERVVQDENEIVTVLVLSGLLTDAAGAPDPAAIPALIYRVGPKAYALAVDEILGEEEIVVKPLKHPLELLPHYSGAAILNDGRIALILDPTNLAHAARAA